jgi:hypothetical protein
MSKSKVLPWTDPDDYGNLDTYLSEDEKLEEIERATKSYRGIAYRPTTDDSAYYDGETYGYEG